VHKASRKERQLTNDDATEPHYVSFQFISVHFNSFQFIPIHFNSFQFISFPSEVAGLVDRQGLVVAYPPTPWETRRWSVAVMCAEEV
jgi:hypothetical protein